MTATHVRQDLLADLSDVFGIGSISELASARGRGDRVPDDLAARAHERIARVDDDVRSFVTVTEVRRSTHDAPPVLDGVPVAVKDVFDLEGHPTRRGSLVDEGTPRRSSAVIVGRLLRAGAVVVGKTNMDELALGVEGSSANAGTVVNPWDEDRIPGGSSSGSATALSTGCVMGSLGAESGGSIRIPAGVQGVYGLKTTAGRLPRRGASVFTPTLDVAGPMARTADDLELLYRVCSGIEARLAPRRSRPCRVGIPDDDYLAEHLDDEVASWFADVVAALRRDHEITVTGVSLPAADAVAAAGALIARREYADALSSEMTERADLITPGRRQLLLAAAGIDHDAYDDALRLRQRIIADVRRHWGSVDVLLMPVLPTWTPRVGSDEVLRTTSLARLANLTGEPAVAVPAGFGGGVPAAVQIHGPAGSELDLLGSARQWWGRGFGGEDS